MIASMYLPDLMAFFRSLRAISTTVRVVTLGYGVRMDSVSRGLRLVRRTVDLRVGKLLTEVFLMKSILSLAITAFSSISILPIRQRRFGFAI